MDEIIQHDIEIIVKNLENFRDKISGKTFLVTGGVGFLGSWFCDVAINFGAKVICVDNLISGDSKNVNHLLTNLNFKFVNSDVINFDTDEKLDYIVHMASIASPPLYMKFPIDTLDANVFGTKRVLEIARKNNVKGFLFMSTSEVYGNPPNEFVPTPESFHGIVNSFGPRSVYDEGKRVAEAYCKAYFQKFNLPVRIARTFNTYGPRLDTKSKTQYGRALVKFISQSLNNQPITVYGDGKQTRSFCYITDQIEGLFRLLLTEGIDGEIFNIGNDEEISIENLAKVIVSLSNNNSRIEMNSIPDYDIKDDPIRRRPDISKARKLLGYSPKIKFSEGLKKTFNWIKMYQNISGNIPKNIFRAYDIRGVFEKELTPEIASDVGKSVGSYFGIGKTIAVGRDVRLSGDILTTNLINGIRSTGCNVVDIGIVPTPVLYFACHNLRVDGGVMVTASHLPPEYNGFKISDGNGIVISDGTGLEKIKEKFFSRNFSTESYGGLSKKDVIGDYINFVISKVSLNKKIKVVLDLANSVSALAAPKILTRLGAEVINLHEELDGRSPNRASEPTEESLQKLRQKVLETNADMGIGYDGDADRMSIVDDKGRIFFSGNILMPMFAMHYLKHRKGKVVMDLTCSSAVEDFVRQNGGEPIVIRVGHSYCSHTTRNENALFGGQFSGHMSFPDTLFTDDAIFASIKMVEIVTANGRKVSEIVDSIPKYFSSKMQEIECSDNVKFLIVDSIKEKFKKLGYKIIDIDGAKIFGPEGWVLIRGSNTAPMIKVIAESKIKGKEEEYHKMGLEAVMEEISKYENPSN